MTGAVVTSGIGQGVSSTIVAAVCRVADENCDPADRRSGEAGSRPSVTPAPATPAPISPPPQGGPSPQGAQTAQPAPSPQAPPPLTKTPEPKPTSAEIKAAKALAAPGLIGANDWNCKPNKAHPRPVVLVHGTFFNGTANWFSTTPTMALNGYCVYALTYGERPGVPALRAIAPVPYSAEQLSTFIDGVLAATGAEEVDIVGHSQGGMMPRYYLKYLGGADKVNTLVGLAPSNHGTTMNGLAALAENYPGAADVVGDLCPACDDQLVGSELMKKLNEGGDTVPGVNYTVIATRHDQLVTPYQSQFLEGPNVHNVVLQDLCPTNGAEHFLLPFHPIAMNEVFNALDPQNAKKTNCW
ncbi:alpha/beta fold hydrolase [Actinomadura sp. HBU206391]|nr:alpha/beta fold hydrolase [Actinomadura sp. HBU206391]